MDRKSRSNKCAKSIANSHPVPSRETARCAPNAASSNSPGARLFSRAARRSWPRADGVRRGEKHCRSGPTAHAPCSIRQQHAALFMNPARLAAAPIFAAPRADLTSGGRSSISSAGSRPSMPRSVGAVPAQLDPPSPWNSMRCDDPLSAHFPLHQGPTVLIN